ncbi:glycosyltransferase [Chloroflexota bacterium]
MKILQIIPYFVPAWAYGGPVRVCYELSKALVRRGHEIVVYTTDVLDARNRIANKKEIIDGIQVTRFKNISNTFAHNHKIFISPSMVSAIKNNLRRFDVVHMHEYRSIQNIVLKHFALKYDIPYVLQAHGSLSRTILKQRLKHIYDSIWGYGLLRNASKAIALNETEVEQYKNMGIEKDRIEIIANGIDQSEYTNLPPKGEFRKKHGYNNSDKIILYLGRIHETKGLDLLVNAFARLLTDLSAAKLVIIGPDDGYLPSLRKLISYLDIENQVLLHGPIYGHEKFEAYIDADVFVTPSFSGFPLTFLEACSMGTPLITTDKGDNLNWIHGRVGQVIPYDENLLRVALLNFLNDDDLRKRFGQQGMSLVRKSFSWDKIVDEIELLYRSVKTN